MSVPVTAPTQPPQPSGGPPNPPEAPATKSAPQPLSWLFLLNLVAVGALGVGISWWLLHYTDNFESAASIFALTGVFSWLAAVSRILPSDRIQSLQSAIDRYVMNSLAALIMFILIGGICLYWADGRGSIQVDSRRDAADRSVRVTGPGADEHLSVDPGGHVRTVVTTSRRAPNSFVVKVAGYPDKRVEIRPWQRLRLTVPTSFYRPVVLMKPSTRLLNQRGQGLRIKVLLNGKPVSEGSSFEGYSFWLGGDEDLSVPTTLLDTWRAELAVQNKPLSLRYYETPVVLAGDRSELKPGDRLTVELLREDGTAFLHREVAVKPFRGPQDFPQVEALDDNPQPQSDSNPAPPPGD